MRLARLLPLLALAAGCFSHERTEHFDWKGTITPGATLHVRDLNGEITVRPGTGNTVEVHGTVDWRRGRNSNVKFVTARDGNDYYVCAVWGSGRCSKNGYRSSTGLGFLATFSLFHRRNDAHAVMELVVPPGVAIDAKTTNGAVTVNGATAPVKARTTNGAIVATGTGTLDAETVNGDVTLASGVSGSQADSIVAKSVNGSVRAVVAAGFAGSFALATVNGEARSALNPNGAAPLVGKRIAGTIGHGAGIITLKTVNGSATLDAR